MTHLYDWLQAKKTQLEAVGVIRNGQVPSHDYLQEDLPDSGSGTHTQYCYSKFKEYLDQLNEGLQRP